MTTVQYVGDPFVDAGVAVLEYRLGRPCSDFTKGDLRAEAERLKREYAKTVWRGYLTLHFPNSGWCNPTIGQEKKEAFLYKVLYGYELDAVKPSRACVYCGRVAQILVDRSYVPLLTGEKIMTAGPGGTPGLPACGYCLCAVQFYPLATLKVNGRPLFWWASDPAWTYLLNGRFLEVVQKVVNASSQQFVNIKWPATQLLRSASEVIEDWSAQESSARPPLCDIIGCHATNYGSEPGYSELRIPRGLLEFWANAGSFGSTYLQIVDAAWQETNRPVRKGRRSKGKTPEPNVEISPEMKRLNRKNDFYEELGGAFKNQDFRDAAKRIAVRFFLKGGRRTEVARRFELTAYFLEKVANMEKGRLEAIREIADAIAHCEGKKEIIDRLMRSTGRLSSFLPVLTYAQRRLSTSGSSIAWPTMLTALGLVDEDDATSRDAWLVSELVLIRIFEQLAKQSPELLTELPEHPELAEESLQTQ